MVWQGNGGNVLRTVTSLLLVVASHCACATSLAVAIQDPHGHAVQDAVVIAIPTHAAPAPVRAAHAIMDQVDRTFVPNVLIVRTGTAVEFPNSDAVSHQVYSFSPAKRFELPLYRGQPHAPIVFDRPGIVVLGCNIHDSMTGYIYVTDSPWFGKSDGEGRWQADVPAGDYRVIAWGPRFTGSDQTLGQQISVTEGRDTVVRIQLQQPLRPKLMPRDNKRLRDY